jgi:hypothetical protein
MTEKEIKKLLFEFENLSKVVTQRTLLELCQYPSRRFEEISSRLLSFFLLPTNEHGFGDLFIRSLIELLDEKKELKYTHRMLIVNTEENAEGRRIDLTIRGDNFVIGIENKINAYLNNPLDVYRKKLVVSGKEYSIGLVLSLRRITDKTCISLMDKNGFKPILYNDFFDKVKRNLGFYLRNSNEKYLTFLNDFIKTIENMESNNILEPEQTAFFYENFEKIDELITLYSKFNEGIHRKQFESLQSLKDELDKQTNVKWWIYEGWDLGCDVRIKNPRIGIESFYRKTKGNPLGEFVIYISTWNVTDWIQIKNRIQELFPGLKDREVGNRVFVDFSIMINPEFNAIVEALQSLHKKLDEGFIKLT